MRLSILENGQARAQRAKLKIMESLGLPVVDIVKTFMYQPEFFGKPFCDLGQELLRGRSDWSIGQRELMGAYTSQANACHF